MRKLASIQIIESITPVENSDNLSVATMFNLGWQVVVKNGEFSVGDKCIFFEIDSVLPDRPEFEFMRSKNFRLKTARLRGALSQGLIMPMSLLDSDYDVDEDVTEVLNVIKYEPNIAANLAGQVKGNFPSFLHKTDSERIQSNTRLLEKYCGVEFEAHEKLDGCVDQDTLISVQINNKNTQITAKELSNIWKDVLIWSYNIATNEYELEKINNCLVQESNDNWFLVTLADNTELILTGNHKIWLPELNCYRSVDKLDGNELIEVNSFNEKNMPVL